ncbi:type IV pilus secretin PilQ [Bacteriovorax sp. BSW11_IV]|uniref:type IV pilus secretin PilQ n=1 Tax=Bacteriovorax sp. BSW11_IV TaxID=1353529 RepID=UPI00038A3A22|nr:type IV pilus secretin PilQ [Bacteriovorax sp. BSW11_IV]EQC47084.1 type IV pilus secretin PilQ [Bacteriovorax sp. BSW11_IV]
MKKGFIIALAAIFFTNVAYSVELQKIDFTQKGEISELELVFDGNDVEASKFQDKEFKQIIIDVKNAKAVEKVLRGFDTSEFSGSIVYVSAYKKPENPNDVRVVLQLRDNVRSLLKRKPNRVVLEVENRFGVFSENTVSKGQSFDEKLAESVNEDSKINVPKSDSVEDILENLTLSGRKKYIGKKITIDVKNLKISNILKMIADASGFNIIMTESVEKLPPLTLNLVNVPWDQALDTILGLGKLVAKKNGIILMINTLEQAAKEQEKELEAKKLKEKDEPLVTKVFLISYSNTKDLIKIIEPYLTKGRGTIALDERTNSLIVKDTVDSLDKAKKIIELLDKQTPQVLIESKIVEVTEGYKKEIGLKEGFNFGYDPVGNVGSNISTVGADLDSGADGGPGFTLSSAPSSGEGARDLFGLQITRFGRLLNLNFKLQLMESESKGKIVASPKVITQNKKKAVIKTVDTTSFSTTTGAGDAAVTSFQQTDASLTLTVTPQVTNEGSISLEIELAKEQFGTRPSAQAPPDKQARSVNTNVLVENGSTIVLGGVYNFEKRETHSGVPFLKDIPLLGWFFRTPSGPEINKNELIIFMTPRIINQEEAGLSNNG